MINSLSVTNYRSFSKTVDIELRPITIFVGPNSSGKSSLLKLFKMMKQACMDVNHRGRRDGYISFGLDGDVFDNLDSIQGNRGKKTIIKFTTSLFRTNDGQLLEDKLFSGGHDNDFEIILEFKSTEQKLFWCGLKRVDGRVDSPILKIDASSSDDRWDIKLQKERMNELYREILKWRKKYPKFIPLNKAEIDEAFNEHYIFARHQNMLYNGLIYQRNTIVSLEKRKDFSWAVEYDFGNYDSNNYKENIGIIEELRNLASEYDDQMEAVHGWYKIFWMFMSDLEDLIANFNERDRIYSPQIFKSLIAGLSEVITVWSSVDKANLLEQYLRSIYNPTMAEIFGEIVTISPLRPHPQPFYTTSELHRYLFQGVDQSKFVDSAELSKLAERIDVDLHHLGCPYTFALKQIKDGGTKPVHMVQFIDKKSNKVFTLDDVGFGYSQLVPIIAAIEGNLDSSQENTVIIEQPELHLHPQFQSRLARIMANGVIGSKRALQSPKQLLIETHSEHIVRGFQIMVAKGIIQPEDIAVYYVDKNNAGSSSVHLYEIDEKGFFTENWPEGFFDQAFIQSMELLAGAN